MAFSRNQTSWSRFNAKNKGAGLRHGFRSGLEELNAKHLERNGEPVVFELVKIKYVVPTTERTYTVDFELRNGILVETKGKFEPQDRAKHLFIKLQHPDLDIRFVFQRPQTPISKGSKTTYAMWADRHGFKWAAKVIPIEWMRESSRPGARGPRTIQVPEASKDLFADSSRQPHKAGHREAGRRAALAGTPKGTT